MILILVLIGLTGCTTTSASVEQDLFKETLLSMIPVLPEVPSLPELKWTYRDGLYCLEEHDVDKLLNYGENDLPLFRWQLEQYQRKLEIILQSL